MTPEHLEKWASRKGIKIVGTGDTTHPGWLEELAEKLEPAEQGLFRLKESFRLPEELERDSTADGEVRFILSAEISTIYKKKDKTRKIHNVIFAPDFETVKRLQNALSKIGNISSDGRPILGLDSRNLLEIALEAGDRIFFLPAHIWTPWFSVLGAKSGFNTIEECYDDLAGHISAVETGLSSDPPMNWMCSFLDRYTLLSNSDAHSPEKLGREANVFDTDISYDAIMAAIRGGQAPAFLGTVEFFPQEGKYHYDGHRKCQICWNPAETLQHGAVCPVCGKGVTVGVMSRVVRLSDRTELPAGINRPPFHSVIPLKEILSEITGVGPGTRQVTRLYNAILQNAGSEFNILLHLPVDEIRAMGNEILAEAIRRMRDREVLIQEGYDGEYGRIRVFEDEEIKSFTAQDSFFGEAVSDRAERDRTRRFIQFDLAEARRLMTEEENLPGADTPAPEDDENRSMNPLQALDPEQRRAAEHASGPALVIAGPGTGKTRVLTARIAHLILDKRIDAEHILAVTFTNKAAETMKERLHALLGIEPVGKLIVSTFHTLGLNIIRHRPESLGRTGHFQIIGREEQARLLQKAFEMERKQTAGLAEIITDVKQHLKTAEEIDDEGQRYLFVQYESLLMQQNLLDLDDLIIQPVRLLESDPDFLAHFRNRYPWCLVDEYQDINEAQYRLIRLLAPGNDANLFVIGDPDQAIYGFRGADVRFIRRFQLDYSNAQLYYLKRSYRCSNHILRASRTVLVEQESEKPSFLEGLQDGVKINISRHPTDKSEAEFVARSIERLMGGLRFFSIDSDITAGHDEAELKSLADVAVLCRIGRMTKTIEKAFHDHGIPYQAVGENPFFLKEPARSAVDLLRFAANPENEFLRKLLEEKSLVPLPDASIRNRILDIGVKAALESLMGRYPQIHTQDKEAVGKRLLDLADSFDRDIEGFLRFTVMGSATDGYRTGLENVTLMTLHASKGLEFDCVFIVGCEDGILPYSLFETHASDVEEEKRLLYVGMTRARKILFLSHAIRRFLHGREYRLDRSPFLDRIEEEWIERTQSEYRRKKKPDTNQMGLF